MISKEEENEKAFRNSLKLIEEWGKENKKPSLYEEILEWYYKHNAIQSGPDIANEITRIVREWLPKEDPRPSYDTMQWNKCIKTMKNNLFPKKDT
jgi:hypothetical protein